MSNTLWKKALIDHLINTTKSVNIMLKNQEVRQLVKIPRDLNSIDDINMLSTEINNAIKFPYLRYMVKDYQPYREK